MELYKVENILGSEGEDASFEYLKSALSFSQPEFHVLRDDSNQTVANSTESAAQIRSILIKSHGILMLIAWLICVTSAVLSIRFLKDQQWANKTFLGVTRWFLIHRFLNTFAVLLITAAFVCIFIVADWQWVGPTIGSNKEMPVWFSVHCMCGLLACCIAWFQFLNSFLRCSAESTFRIIFNVIHGIFGICGWMLASTTIFAAVTQFISLFSDPALAKTLFFIYLAVVLISFILLEIIRVRNKWKKSEQSSNIVLMTKRALNETSRFGVNSLAKARHNNFLDDKTVNVEENKSSLINTLQIGLIICCLTSGVVLIIIICVLIASV
uniref:ascorbate ferrireductase (transmembrane) n=1 Tax=Ditylenchus dipsaci TaxID=166011 RepID=A0A915DVK6_9BILA